jgi:ribosomal protein S18 acetylase RimI-like enzyme
MTEQVALESPIQFTLRPVCGDDMNFLQTVYASTRADELTQLPWNEEQRSAFIRMQFTAQRQHYLKFYPNAKQEVILIGEEPIGRLYVNRGDAIHIIDITVLPEHRGKGIGTAILSALIEEATEARKATTIYVETYNRSKQLFERFGFKEIEKDGFNLLLERPSGVSA